MSKKKPDLGVDLGGRPVNGKVLLWVTRFAYIFMIVMLVVTDVCFFFTLRGKNVIFALMMNIFFVPAILMCIWMYKTETEDIKKTNEEEVRKRKGGKG